MRSILLISVISTVFISQLFSQRACVIQQTIASASEVAENNSSAPSQDIIVIPVVVHIVYSNAAENISNQQVLSQIAVLNNDFRKMNADTIHIPSVFKSLAADARINFKLATKDPAGLPTTGIIRKNTSMAGFSIDDKIKSSATGGDDPWDRNQYLNIWVGNL